MRWMGLLAITLLSLGVGACGGAGRAARRTSGIAPTAAATGGTPVGTATAPAPTLPPVPRSAERYLNDADGDIGGTRANRGYRDGDDGNILAYGRAAGAPESRTVTAIVKRYYALAAAGDGAAACSMLAPSLVKAAPLGYGRLGPSYLRGAKTCQAVTARLFRHARGELSARAEVTGVLVNGDRAYALLGSPRMHASYVMLQREGGAWRLAALLGDGMP